LHQNRWERGSKSPKSADCITGTSVGQLDEVVENAEQTDFWRTTRMWSLSSAIIASFLQIFSSGVNRHVFAERRLIFR
jgi:hypothetical protein